MSYFGGNRHICARRLLHGPKAASCFWRLKPYANFAAGIFVLKDNSGLLKRGLDPHKGRDVAHSRRGGRLFGLFWPLRIAQSYTRAAAVLVDEFDASHFQSTPNCQVIGSRHGRLAVGQLGAAASPSSGG